MIIWPPINQNPKPMFALHLQVGDFATDWHSHPKHQLLYAEDGVLHLHSGTQKLILPARHGAWIPAHRSHKIYSKSPDLYLRTLYFDQQDNDEALLGQFHIFSISTLAREMIVYTQKWSMEGKADRVETSFFETIRLLAIEWCQQTMPLVLPTTTHESLEEITTYIGENLMHPLQLETVAQRYGFSGRTLLRLFKDQLGMTFGAYLRVARVIRAIELLTEPKASVTSVAYEVGYNSLSAFSHTFQQLTGVKPSAYLSNNIRGEQR
ncbi:MAG: helix-turn-helix transcriptional regulator [Chloroflexota bacterium]